MGGRPFCYIPKSICGIGVAAPLNQEETIEVVQGCGTDATLIVVVPGPTGTNPGHFSGILPLSWPGNNWDPPRRSWTLLSLQPSPGETI